jgi:hypothetical protein
MQVKLTLRLDEDLINKVKRYTARSGKSISKLVADYFRMIDDGPHEEEKDLTPRVRSLRGVLGGKKVSADDYKRHLEAKHG